MTKIIVIHGPAGVGKSTIAARLRDEFDEPVALISQDAIYNDMLGSDGIPAKVEAVKLVELILRQLSSDGFNIILEGVFRAEYFRPVFTRLNREFEITYIFLEANVEATVLRHAARPKHNHDFGEDKIREWHRSSEPFGFENETIIMTDEHTSEDTFSLVQSALNGDTPHE